MRTIRKRYLQMNKSVFIYFIDYEKAFDRVMHGKLIKCLADIDVRGRDVRFIRNLLETKGICSTTEGEFW